MHKYIDLLVAWVLCYQERPCLVSLTPVYCEVEAQ